jgi:crotonobetainyl-CoA:carnitine CoA-transferase CaiB-like acyl-CoA transferase
MTRTKEEWFQKLGPKNIAIAPVYELDEVFSDPHIMHRKMVMEVDHPRLGKVKHAGIGLKFSETPGEIRHTAPVQGQHTDEILVELDYSRDKIARLREIGAIV